jgi:urease accessory protein
MRTISSDAPAGSPHQDTLTLPFDQRQKSRQRARLDSGEEVGLTLARGRVLRGGDRLLASDTKVVLVQAQAEDVSTVPSQDAHALARVAYHLGNRHVPVQIGDGWLRYLHDHVLDDMVRALGLPVALHHAPFEPEAGAYGHGHGHEHPGDTEAGGHASASRLHGSHAHAPHSHAPAHDAHPSHSHAEVDPSAGAPPSDRPETRKA